MKDFDLLDRDIKETLVEALTASTTQEEKLGVIQSLIQSQICRDQQTTHKLLERILKELQNGKEEKHWTKLRNSEITREEAAKIIAGIQDEKTPEVSSEPVGSHDPEEFYADRPHDPGSF